MTPDLPGGPHIPEPSQEGAVETLSGERVLDELGERLDELHTAAGMPVTNRRPWLTAWARAYSSYEPWAVLVRDRVSGRLDAAALLCRRESERGIEVAALGHGRNDRTRMAARTPKAAATVAEAIVENLTSLPREWTFRLDQLPRQDTVATTIVRLLPSTCLVPAAPVPMVAFGSGGDIDAYLGKGMRKQLRRSGRRLEEARITSRIEFHDVPEIIMHLIAEVERTHKERDHAIGRRSDLDSEPALEFWRNVILQHAQRQEVEVAILRMNGDVAAYVVSLLDTRSYRVLDGRLAPAWAGYSPGRLVEAATLGKALSDPRFTELDWMNSVASEKLLAANAFERTEHLVGRSPRAGERTSAPLEMVILDEKVYGRPTADLALAALQGVG